MISAVKQVKDRVSPILHRLHSISIRRTRWRRQAEIITCRQLKTTMSSKRASRKRTAAPTDSSNNVEQESMVPEGMLPSYLAEAFGELYAEDGLLVLGKGLGLLSLMATFVRFYADTKEGHVSLLSNGEQTTKPPLVFVLGLQRGRVPSNGFHFGIVGNRSGITAHHDYQRVWTRKGSSR